MISVIIPLYNKEKQIRATLESVLQQSEPDYEIVIVNDGSTDKSASIVASFADPRIRLIHQENAGVSAARNRGIDEARGEFVAFLDADDRWHPDFLKTLKKLAEDYSHCSVFASNYEFVLPDGTRKPTVIRRLPFTEEQGELTNYFEVAAHSHPPLWTSALAVRKDAMKAIGGFPMGIKAGEDLLTWARLACGFRVAYTRKVLAAYVLDVSDRPKRMPENPDLVGVFLDELLQRFGELTCLKHYCALWHKMRAWCYMKTGDVGECYDEVCKAFHYHFLWKLPIFVLFSVYYKIFRRL